MFDSSSSQPRSSPFDSPSNYSSPPAFETPVSNPKNILFSQIYLLPGTVSRFKKLIRGMGIWEKTLHGRIGSILVFNLVVKGNRLECI
jgi:hypothetical protein